MELTEREKRTKRCCFTGHRPEKLNIPEEIVRDKLKMAIDMALGQGFRTFICGMARGVDLWAGKEVVLRKQTNSEIKLICATPFPGFEKKWNQYWRDLYFELVDMADYKVAVCQTYTRNCFQKRNEWMVTHAGLVIAAYDGEPGGTRNTVLFANKCGVPVYKVVSSIFRKLVCRLWHE